MSFRALQCTGLEKTFGAAVSALSMASLQGQRILGSTEVRVKVIASALNYFDLLMLVGRYQHKPKLPFTPGSEAAGVVVEVGSNVEHIRVGDEVAMAMAGGAMAEEMVVEASVCFPKPCNFSFAEAAAYFVGYCTAYHGLVQRGHLKKGETLLVTGAGGGMGSIAVQLGKLLGATVIAAASSEEKLHAAKSLGADHLINYKDSDLNKEVKDITSGRGADVVYEVCGGEVFEKCARCTAGGGRLLVIGFASGRIPKVAANLPLVKGYSVVGVRAGAEMMLQPDLALEMFAKASKWGKSGSLQPPPIQVVNVNGDGDEEAVSKIRSLFQSMADRSIVGKGVVHWRSVPDEHRARL